MHLNEPFMLWSACSGRRGRIASAEKMRHSLIQALCCASVFALFVVSGSHVSAQERYRLQETYAAGDVSEIEVSTKYQFTTHAGVGGLELDKNTHGERNHAKLVERIMSVDAASHVDCYRVAYSIAHQVDITPEGDTGGDRSVLGKVITVRRTGDKVTITPDKGKIDDEDKAVLRSNMLNIERSEFSIPDRDIPVGEEWPVDGQRFIRAFEFPHGTTAKGNAKFVGIVENQGHKCAHIHMAVKVNLLTPGLTGETTNDLEGDLYHALDIHKTLSMYLNGPITLTAREKVNGFDVDITGSGSADVALSIDYKMLAGKPVVKK